MSVAGFPVNAQFSLLVEQSHYTALKNKTNRIPFLCQLCPREPSPIGSKEDLPVPRGIPCREAPPPIRAAGMS